MKYTQENIMNAVESAKLSIKEYTNNVLCAYKIKKWYLKIDYSLNLILCVPYVIKYTDGTIRELELQHEILKEN